MNMHDTLSTMMGEPLYGYAPHLLQEPTERSIPSIPGGRGAKRQKVDNSSIPKRRPYTRLACFNCRDKHQKCDGQKPACFNCLSKGLECHYREERNKRRCVPCQLATDHCPRDTEGNEDVSMLRVELEFWQTKYMELKRFVDESLYHISLSQQLMPFATIQTPPTTTQTQTQTPHSPPTTTSQMELKSNKPEQLQPGLVSDTMLGMLPSFDFYASLNGEGDGMKGRKRANTYPPLVGNNLFSNNLLSNPNLGHTLMGSQLTAEPGDLKDIQSLPHPSLHPSLQTLPPMFSQGYQLPTSQ